MTIPTHTESNKGFVADDKFIETELEAAVTRLTGELAVDVVSLVPPVAAHTFAGVDVLGVSVVANAQIHCKATVVERAACVASSGKLVDGNVSSAR